MMTPDEIRKRAEQILENLESLDTWEGQLAYIAGFVAASARLNDRANGEWLQGTPGRDGRFLLAYLELGKPGSERIDVADFFRPADSKFWTVTDQHGEAWSVPQKDVLGWRELPPFPTQPKKE